MAGAAGILAALAWAGTDRPTGFSNQGSVANTRHNMTQRTAANMGGGGAAAMAGTRNDYGEVCVYCHTPHGGHTAVRAPLWNRTIATNSYRIYESASLTQDVRAPGTNSLTCLSCHDGVTAIDSIINMPGYGGYSKAQEYSVDKAFLNTWRGAGGASGHQAMGLQGESCMNCHSPGGASPNATDFTAFVVGTDLRDDHPVGVRYPESGRGADDFKPLTATKGNVRFFDLNGSGRPDENEIRVYDSGDGFRVECASCHDPHGVPTAGSGSPFIRSFLRVDNGGSAVCLSCHVK